MEGSVIKHEVAYRLCCKCARAVPLESDELFCSNDGEKLLEACPKCQARISNPFARFCAVCGKDFFAKENT